MSQFDLITFCTHEYFWLYKPLVYLFEKYCPALDHIICFGDRVENSLPDSVEFIPTEDPWDWLEYFGRGMKKALESLEDDLVFISLPDMWPIAPMDMQLFIELTNCIMRDRNIIHALVGYDGNVINRGIVYRELDRLTLVRSDLMDPNIGMVGGPLLWPSLWNRKAVIPLIVDRSTIWDFEVMHTHKMRDSPNMFGVWTWQEIYPYAHVMSRYNTQQIYFVAKPDDEDLYAIRELLPSRIELIELWK